jgi:lipopolysaccharide export system permease protein
VLLSIGQALAEQALVAVPVGLWLPNVVFAVLGGYLFAQAARERTLEQFERMRELVGTLRTKLLARLGAEASP